MSEALRVVVADDHPFYRKGLVRALRDTGIDVVAEAPNGEAAILAVEAMSPDVVVMDLKMPGLSGLEATRVLTNRRPASRVLVLSVSAEDEDVVDALLAGAAGYVLKERPAHEVVAGIRAAAHGASHLSPAIAMRLLRRLCEPRGTGLDITSGSLSEGERELLDQLAADRSDHEIATTLACDTTTVGEHAAGILAKLRTDGQLSAALRAYRRRLE